MNLHKLKDDVQEIMVEKKETRNCDNTLVWQYMARFHPCGISIYGGRHHMCVEYMIKNRISVESITRQRRLLQEKYMNLCPTDWEVAKHRRYKKEEWEEFIRQPEPTMKDPGQMRLFG